MIDVPLGSESIVNASGFRTDISANSSPRNRYTFDRKSPVDMLVNHRGLLSRKMFRSSVAPAGSSCRSSIQMFPIKALANDGKTVEIEYGALPDGSIASFGSSNESLDKVWSPPPSQKDDLYSWMAKAHNETKNVSSDKHVVCVEYN